MNDITKKINDLLNEAARLEGLTNKAKENGLNVASMRHYEALGVTAGEAFTSAQAQAITGLSQAGASALLNRLIASDLAVKVKPYKSATLMYMLK
jgi:Fic family protein